MKKLTAFSQLRILAVMGRYGSHRDLMIVMIFVTQNKMIVMIFVTQNFKTVQEFPTVSLDFTIICLLALKIYI